MIGPIKWSKLAEYQEKHRNLCCPCYDTCLTFAAKKYWFGFTCLFCLKNPKGKE